jgi:hypothetical protein
VTQKRLLELLNIMATIGESSNTFAFFFLLKKSGCECATDQKMLEDII